MNFTPSTLHDICAVTSTFLSLTFPGQNWVVLPEILAEQGKLGLFVSTRCPGAVTSDSGSADDLIIVSRPQVDIVNPGALGTPTMLQELAEAFKKQLDAAQPKLEVSGTETQA